MKKLALTLFLVFAMGTSASAHQGSIGLYTDQTASDCDATFIEGVPVNLYIMYYKGTSGPNGIHGAEFKFEYDDMILFFGALTLPSGALSLGNIDSGIAITFSACTGIGADYVWIGTIPAFADDASAPFNIRVGQSDGVQNPPLPGHPAVATCIGARDEVGVLGGYFHHPNGACNIGTAPSSWGAIKDLYRY